MKKPVCDLCGAAHYSYEPHDLKVGRVTPAVTPVGETAKRVTPSVTFSTGVTPSVTPTGDLIKRIEALERRVGALENKRVRSGAEREATGEELPRSADKKIADLPLKKGGPKS
jgi:hypothetical protein